MEEHTSTVLNKKVRTRERGERVGVNINSPLQTFPRPTGLLGFFLGVVGGHNPKSSVEKVKSSQLFTEILINS